GIILNVTITTLVMNAIFAYILVLGHFGFPAMGLEGASIVSVVVQTAGFLFIVPAAAREEFLVKVMMNHKLLEVQDGF
ncbi:hypothetical protein ACC719_36690, partial [Rhizobium ruizarguesonis]